LWYRILELCKRKLTTSVAETLRKYPSIPVIPRRCTKDYKIPQTDIILKKGTNVFIPLLGLHYDDEYYPDPEVFDPERFSEENKKTRPPLTWLAFGDGPRVCIGKLQNVARQ
jgi:cytochrome P450 family 6